MLELEFGPVLSMGFFPKAMHTSSQWEVLCSSSTLGWGGDGQASRT